MPDPLELTVQSFTADQLAIKVKNISSEVLGKSLVIEFYVPSYLVTTKVKDASKAAATNKKPLGVATLAGVVTGGPEGWSVWAKRETSQSTVIVALMNDLNQSGIDLPTPIKVAAGAEFTISIPLNPQAARTSLNVNYSYQHGTDPRTDKPVRGKLEIDTSDQGDEIYVELNSNHPTPTMIPPGSSAKIIWAIKDGVSATLRGPLPGGNSELPLSAEPQADFKISGGSVDVIVIGGMTYILQAEVKRKGKPNLQVTRMLSLDTTNNKYNYIAPHPPKVLPYGLIEISWASWGVKDVIISVSGHTTRDITLTQQTLGRFYEGSGIMRAIATKQVGDKKTEVERIIIEGDGDSMTKQVEVRSWIPMQKPAIQGQVFGMAVIAPMMAVLTDEALFIANVRTEDPSPPLEKLSFSQMQPPPGYYMWRAMTAVDDKFLCLRMLTDTANLEIVPYTPTGTPDTIPPVTLPEEVRYVSAMYDCVIDFIGVGGRAYFVAEASKVLGTDRIAYSVAFDSKTQKANVRREPLLEPLLGYRIVAFDNAIYALDRKSGRMFRFDVTTANTLEPATKAASAVKKGAREGSPDQSMIADGFFLPLGGVFVVMNPTAVPTLESLEPYGLQNTLTYTGSSSLRDDIPQDLVYNPQRDYWGRCGHDIDIKPKTRMAFRDNSSKRLWMIQDETNLQTLSVGSETLFSHDFVPGFPTKPLAPFINKKRQVKLTNNTGMQLLPITPEYTEQGLANFTLYGPGEIDFNFPQNFRSGMTETVEFTYNQAEPLPIVVRFLVDTSPGVPHHYVLEVTFSGPDLATATSVFKRLAGEKRTMTAVEIPGTSVQHSTNNPVVIPPPKRLVEGVKFRAQNGTTYKLWREAPGARRDDILEPYSGEEIRITYNTPAFYLLGYGAGELHINVDFSLPAGIEISSGSQKQTKVVRINPDNSTGLNPELLPNKDETSYECVVRYIRKQELKYVYLGDGVATERGEAIYLPVAVADMQAMSRIIKIDPDNLALTESTVIQGTNNYAPFLTPNSIALSNIYVFAMLGDTNVHVFDYSLQYQDKVNVGDAYAVVTGLTGSAYTSTYFFLGVKKDRTNTQGISVHHTLTGKTISKNNSGVRKLDTGNDREVSLDAVKGFREANRMTGYPTWVSSKTVSPIAPSTSIVSPRGARGREVAICIDGGVIVVGENEASIRTVAIESAGREEAVVFGREGKTIYCLHSQGDNQGLRVTRVDNVALKQTHSLTLPVGEGVADLATDPRPRQAGTPYKNHRSASMVIALDEKLLFVSHGRSIFKIEAATMTLKGTFKVELPCRLMHLWWGKPSQESSELYGRGPGSCTLLYAIGSSYKSEGMTTRDFKTHIYKLAIPD